MTLSICFKDSIGSDWITLARAASAWHAAWIAVAAVEHFHESIGVRIFDGTHCYDPKRWDFDPVRLSNAIQKGRG